ncbi:MAG: HDOD domain-containing protein [Planctomycetes bacterium]|nr:HDOD domain-containing protein [Planctomycetota bacterium]
MKWRYLVILSRDAHVVRWVGARIGAVGWKFIAAKDIGQAAACVRQTEVDGILLPGDDPDAAGAARTCADLYDRIPSIPIIAFTEHPVVDAALCLRIAGAHAVLDRGSLHARNLELALASTPGNALEHTVGFPPAAILRRLDRVLAARTLPGPLIALMGAGSSALPRPAELASILGEDPVLAERARTFACHVLDLPATPDEAPLEDLLARIPLPRLREVAVSYLLFDALAPHSLAANLFGLPLHAAGCAAAARILAGLTEGADPDLAFDAGLLHDVGISLLARAAPGAYERVIALARQGRTDLSSAEHRILGEMSHAEVSARATAAWGLPAAFAEAARSTHAVACPPSTAFGRLLLAAHAVAEALDLSLRIRETPASRTAADLLGVEEAVIARATAGLGEQAAEAAAILSRPRRAESLMRM